MRSEQRQARELWESQPAGHSFGAGLRVVPDELQAAIVLFCSLLDERQRRLYAGRLRAYVDGEYHHAPHRGLAGNTPFDQWAIVSGGVLYLEAAVACHPARTRGTRETLSIHSLPVLTCYVDCKRLTG